MKTIVDKQSYKYYRKSSEAWNADTYLKFDTITVLTTINILEF